MSSLSFNIEAFLKAECEEHAATLKAMHDSALVGFPAFVTAWAASIRQGGKILFFGNGGSASDAQHLATELSVRYKKDRPAIAALSLATDTSTLTAAGNDLGFEHIFARQIEAVGRKGDVAIGISTSGKSPNVIEGLRQARDQGLVTVAFTGGEGGSLPALSDHCFIVPSAVTARIQEMHILLGHMLCEALEIELGLAARS